jgi:hypothetical protein
MAIKDLAYLALMYYISIFHMAVTFSTSYIKLPNQAIIEETNCVMCLRCYLFIIAGEKEVDLTRWNHTFKSEWNLLYTAKVSRSVTFEAEVHPQMALKCAFSRKCNLLLKPTLTYPAAVS